MGFGVLFGAKFYTKKNHSKKYVPTVKSTQYLLYDEG